MRLRRLREQRRKLAARRERYKCGDEAMRECGGPDTLRRTGAVRFVIPSAVEGSALTEALQLRNADLKRRSREKARFPFHGVRFLEKRYRPVPSFNESDPLNR
jgi:hypothetical protein